LEVAEEEFFEEIQETSEEGNSWWNFFWPKRQIQVQKVNITLMK